MAMSPCNREGLVASDLVLPKMSGFELLAEWRRDPRTADLPVFVLVSKDLNKEERSTSMRRRKHSFESSIPCRKHSFSNYCG